MSKILAGLGKGKKLDFGMFGYISIPRGMGRYVLIRKDTVDTWQVIDQNTRKSVVSAVGRAFVGGVILGAPGLFAGLTAKSKSKTIVEIVFKDGAESLVEVDASEYKKLIKALY